MERGAHPRRVPEMNALMAANDLGEFGRVNFGIYMQEGGRLLITRPSINRPEC